MPKILDEDGTFISHADRRAEATRHRIVCPYRTDSARDAKDVRLRLYGNMPPLKKGWSVDKNVFIARVLRNGDDHDLIKDLAETKANRAQLRQLKRARKALDAWKDLEPSRKTDPKAEHIRFETRPVITGGRFSTLSIAERGEILRRLKLVYCPKCLEEIDFGIEVRYSFAG